jgi:hypothetical protein
MFSNVDMGSLDAIDLDQMSENPRYMQSLKRVMQTSVSTSVDQFPMLPDLSIEMHRLEEDIE